MGTRSLEASLCLSSIVSGTHVPSSFILSQCRGPIARGLSEAEEEEVAAGADPDARAVSASASASSRLGPDDIAAASAARGGAREGGGESERASKGAVRGDSSRDVVVADARRCGDARGEEAAEPARRLRSLFDAVAAPPTE